MQKNSMPISWCVHKSNVLAKLFSSLCLGNMRKSSINVPIFWCAQDQCTCKAVFITIFSNMRKNSTEHADFLASTIAMCLRSYFHHYVLARCRRTACNMRIPWCVHKSNVLAKLFSSVWLGNMQKNSMQRAHFLKSTRALCLRSCFHQCG